MTPAPNRRWFRFSLRTLFVVVTILCVWLGIRFHREPISAANLSRLGVISKQLDNDIYKIVWNADGSRVALVRFDKPVRICEGRTLLPLFTVAEGKKVVQFAFSPNKGVVAFGENNKTARIVDLDTGAEKEILTANAQPHVAFSPDGKLLATGGYGTSAFLWDVPTGKLIRSFDVDTVGGLTVVFSPDGFMLLVGNRNSVTTAFDVASGRRLYQLNKPCSQELAFDPSGRFIAVGYVDGRTGIWSSATGELLHLKKSDAEEVFVVDWSPDGNMLISAGLHGRITIWDPTTMDVLRQLPTREAVFSVKFRPDQRSFITSEGTQMTGKARYLQEWEVSLLSKEPSP
jgi:WD40 repeat protein